MNRPQVVYFLSDQLVYFPSGVRMQGGKRVFTAGGPDAFSK